MGGSWYYRNSGQQAGPLHFEQLRQLASTGELTPDDEVRSGHGYWQEARSVDELWTDGGLDRENGAAQRAEDSSGGVLLDMSELDDLDVADSAPEPSLTPASDDRQFFCRKSGERDEIGPVALAVLQAEADNGRLTPNDRIREEGSLCWIPCGELGALNFPEAGTIRTETQRTGLEDTSAEPAEEDAAEQAVETSAVSASEEAEWEEVLFAPQEEDAAEVTATPVPRPSAVAVEEEPVAETPSNRAAATLASLAAEAAAATETPEPKGSKRKKRSGKGFQVHQMNKSLLYVLGALVVVLAVVKLWPSSSGFHGDVLVDGHPLPVGSVTITPEGGNPREGLSLGVVDGRFEAGNEQVLEPGGYDVVVTIGNPLGLPTPKLEESAALAGLNGAKLSTRIEVRGGETDAVLMELSSSDAAPAEEGGTSVIGTE